MFNVVVWGWTASLCLLVEDQRSIADPTNHSSWTRWPELNVNVGQLVLDISESGFISTDVFVFITDERKPWLVKGWRRECD